MIRFAILPLLVLAACGQMATEDEQVDPTVLQVDHRAATMAAACSGCHADPADGIVSLDGMDAETITASLLSYKADADGTSVMHRLARGYSDAQVRTIAAFLADNEGR